MRCDEVMELMQRHLDGDLNEEEYSRMMDHLEACPECAEFKERLEKIDRDLASLPKVTPPYSLVDAILPELERLDAQLGEISGSDEAASPRSTSSRQRWFQHRRVMQWGGIGAAAALLGILIVNGLPSDLDKRAITTQELASSAGSAESAADAASPASGAAPEIMLMQEVDDHSAGGTADGSARAEAPELKVERMEAEGTPPSSAAPGSGANANESSSDNAANLPETVTGPAEPVSEPAREQAEAKPGNEGSRAAEPVPPSEPALDRAGFGVAGSPGGEAESPKDADPVGITSIELAEAELRRLESEDGRFAAQVQADPESGELQVVVVNRAGEALVHSEETWNEDAEITLLDWDGPVLTYTVATPEGERMFQIDAAEQMELEIDPEP